MRRSFLRRPAPPAVEQRNKLMKLMWDTIGSEFGGRRRR